jgi:hypothetical protein
MLFHMNSAAKSTFPCRVTSWNGDGSSVKYDLEEQCCVVAYHHRHEEYNESRFDNMSTIISAKPLKINVIAVVSEPINFVKSEGLNRSQFKDFLSDVHSQ